MRIREEQSSDRAAVRTVVVDAFGRPQEADLVDALRDAGDLAISLVAAEDDRLCGHVALSRLKSPAKSLALAPVSVRTADQCRGIGARLVRDALTRARRCDYEIVFVVGEPAYYTRFGFSAGAAAPFPCPYAGPYFMALWLTDARPAPAPVVYAAAFRDLD